MARFFLAVVVLLELAGVGLLFPTSGEWGVMAGQAATFASSPAPASPPQGFLRVQGRDILDGNGQPVFLRDVNMHT